MKKLKSIILPLSFICLAVCVIFFLQYFIDGIQDQKEKEDLIRNKEAITNLADTDINLPENRVILPQYKTLYEENSDLIGWIKIKDTPLDYPVMQNMEDNEYYLHRNYYEEYEYSGLPFLDIKCSIDPPSTNLMIYGHNMKSDVMFSCLTKYIDEEYYLQHPIIKFDTLYEESEYQIVSIILSKVYMKSDDVFKFYQFVQADSEAEFDEYILNMKKLSLYDTGFGASYGDQLLTLVTCNYHTENGRLAVLAKKVRN